MARRDPDEHDRWRAVEWALAAVGIGGWLALLASWLVHLAGPAVADWARGG